jgi:hypothetical protein
MAEAILTGKKIKEFSFCQGFALYRTPYTIFPGFSEHFFMCNCP